MITTKQQLREFLKYESKLYERKTFRPPLFAIKEKDILYKFNYLLRKTEYYTNTNKKTLKLFYKFRLNRYSYKYMITIPINTFDKGLKLIHIGPRLVNGRAQIGKNCVMHINTCIVAGGINDFVPKIGENVILGVGSVISGSAIIGNNVAVGANSFVNKDFSEGNMTIAGCPAKKISNKTRKDWNKTKEGQLDILD